MTSHQSSNRQCPSLGRRRTTSPKAVAGKTPVVPQHDPLIHTLRERATQIVLRIIIHQRAGIHPNLVALLHQHPRIGAHEVGTSLFGRILLHTGLGNLRAAVFRAGGTQIRKRGKRQVLRNIPFPEDVTESRLDICRNFLRIGLAGNGHLEALFNQPADALQGLIKAAVTAVLVVTGPVREVQADPEMNRVGVCPAKAVPDAGACAAARWR